MLFKPKGQKNKTTPKDGKEKKKTKKKKSEFFCSGIFLSLLPQFSFPIDENILKEKINHHPLSTGQKFELI
jgi:hypothetical protein